MTTLLLILWLITLVGLIFVQACLPVRSRHSWFELQRHEEKHIIRREHLLGDVLALRRVISGLLLACLVLIGIALWQVVGVLIAIIVWLVAGVVGRWRPLRGLSMKLYEQFEPRLLSLLEHAPALGKLFRDDTYVPHDQHFESIEQLLHLVEASGHVLSDDQREIIKRGINWHTKVVSSIMIPAKDIVSVKHSELIGPLVLDDLHRSGHHIFPVIRGNVDTIVGILDIAKLLEVSVVTRSVTAEKAMSPNVLRIEADETLPVALTMLQKGNQHMLIVVDDEGKTMGVVALADITESLLGKTGVKW